MVIFSVSSTYYLTTTCWIGLLSAPSDLPARACTHWSVPAPRSFHWPCIEQGPLLVLSVRAPWSCATFSWTGPELALQSPFIWSAVSRNSSQSEVPFSGFTYSFNFSLAFCFFDYFGQDHFVPELEVPFSSRRNSFPLFIRKYLSFRGRRSQVVFFWLKKHFCVFFFLFSPPFSPLSSPLLSFPSSFHLSFLFR